MCVYMCLPLCVLFVCVSACGIFVCGSVCVCVSLLSVSVSLSNCVFIFVYFCLESLLSADHLHHLQWSFHLYIQCLWYTYKQTAYNQPKPKMPATFLTTADKVCRRRIPIFLYIGEWKEWISTKNRSFSSSFAVALAASPNGLHIDRSQPHLHAELCCSQAILAEMFSRKAS